VPDAAHHLERRRHRQVSRSGAERQRSAQEHEHRPAHRAARRYDQREARFAEAAGFGEEGGFAPDASAASAVRAARLGAAASRADADQCLASAGDMAISDRPESSHSATELLEVERLTTALSADWLEQYGVLPLRLASDVLSVGTWLDRVEPLALDD